MNSRLRRSEKVGLGAFVTVWILVALGTVAFWGVVVWAIIKLVGVVTS